MIGLQIVRLVIIRPQESIVKKHSPFLFSGGLLLSAWFISGCESFRPSTDDEQWKEAHDAMYEAGWDQTHNVDYYKSRGMNERDAQKNAAEDGIIDQLQNHP